MSCKCAIPTDQYHGWECTVSGGECMFLVPNSKACAKKYGEGPDADTIKEEGLSQMSRTEVFLNPIIRNCRTCKSQFEISSTTQQKLADQNKSLPTHCQDCLDKKRAGHFEACKECGEQFFISELEREQYERKKLVPRVRCWPCKDKKKVAGK